MNLPNFFDRIQIAFRENPNLGLYLLLSVLLVMVGWRAWKVLTSERSLSGWALFLIVHLYVPLMWRVRTNRRCPFPAEGPGLIIANHRSPVDPLLVCTWNHLGPQNRLFRLISFLMAKEYYDIPGVAWACRTMDCVPIARAGRDMQGVKDCFKLLKDGHLVGIFPEGRINKGEGVLPFGSGIAWLALKAEVPIYPVFIQNSPVSDSMVKPFAKPARSRLVYGEPIDLQELFPDRKGKETMQEVTQLLHDRLAELEHV